MFRTLGHPVWSARKWSELHFFLDVILIPATGYKTEHSDTNHDYSLAIWPSAAYVLPWEYGYPWQYDMRTLSKFSQIVAGGYAGGGNEDMQDYVLAIFRYRIFLTLPQDCWLKFIFFHEVVSYRCVRLPFIVRSILEFDFFNLSKIWFAQKTVPLA